MDIITSPYDDIELAEVSLHAYVLEGAAGRPGRPALIGGSTGEVLTYPELARTVRVTAAGLAAHGVAKGDVLALCGPNSPDWVLAYLAALTAGAIVTTVNPLAPPADVARQLGQSGARWLITATNEGCGGVPGIRETFTFGEAVGGTPLAALADPERGAELPAVGPDDDAVLLYSSGTTGLPKGALLTHRALVASLCQTDAVQRVRADDVLLTTLPLYHIFALQVTLGLGLRAGAAVVTMARFGIEDFLALIQAHRVTRLEVVPPIVLALARHPAVAGYDVSSLRSITSGGAPLGADLAAECVQRLGCVVKQGYGMTELGGASHWAPHTGAVRPESIGPPLPGTECRVIDCASGLDVASGERGELLVRTPGTMRCYLGNPAATAATIDAGGWLHTGDVVIADREGWFMVVDRVKELIKYKGSQVAPAALEAILLTHPGVADVAVAGTPDEEAGEIPTAYVVPREDTGTTAGELIGYVAGRVAPHEKIRRVEFVPAIPKSPSGKILRRLLKPSPAPVLAGTVSVVTGGGRGIGRVLARSLAAAGSAVGLIARSGDELAETVRLVTAAGGAAAAACADITDADATAMAIKQLAEQLGPVNLLVNNAGVGGPVGDAWDVDADDWWRAIEVNLHGVFLCSRLVLPGMIARGGGRIVNITSEAGVYRWPQLSAYSVSKAAVIKFTENLAVEAGRRGVRAFSVHPGITPIGLSEQALAGRAGPDSPRGRRNAWIRAQLAAGRGADPALVAALVTRLAAGDADRLSGCHLSVHDDVDAILARTDDVRDRYQLRLAPA
jgi:acyl-CoA synthetase (AMP-forming)/AMP-acid ligase II/NAD(P)-dependent dehydrogenase (short-subunit alcohol dehydrogenase family)